MSSQDRERKVRRRKTAMRVTGKSVFVIAQAQAKRDQRTTQTGAAK